MFGCVRNLTSKLNFTFWAYRLFGIWLWILFSVFQGVSSNSSWEQAMKMIINDPRYRYTIVLWLVYLAYNSTWELCPSEVDFSFSFIIKVHFPNWVRRNRLSMPTKSKLRRKRRRRPELNTRSPKRPFRGSWRTMRRWHLPPDTSKSSRDLIMQSFFPCFLLYTLFICGDKLLIWYRSWEQWKVTYGLSMSSQSCGTGSSCLTFVAESKGCELVTLTKTQF